MHLCLKFSFNKYTFRLNGFFFLLNILKHEYTIIIEVIDLHIMIANCKNQIQHLVSYENNKS